MTSIMQVINADYELSENLYDNRPPNNVFDEVLYADDTIIFSTCTDTLQKYLHKIEDTAIKYELHLNKKKCEAIDTNAGKAEDIHFKDGKKIKQKSHDFSMKNKTEQAVQSYATCRSRLFILQCWKCYLLLTKEYDDNPK